MLSKIWFGFMATALVVAAFNGRASEVTAAIFSSARAGGQIALELVGFMALWLGLMRVAEKAGLISMVGRALQPVLRLLFPAVPAGHPAMGALVLSVAANMLGLNNAATPLGLKAMEEFQKLNDRKDVATDAQVTFMALNTSGVQLVPATMIAVLAQSGSHNPSAIIGPSLVATLAGTVAAVVASRVLQRSSPRADPPPPPPPGEGLPGATGAAGEVKP